MIDDTVAYNALTSRDPRFDGLFFVGVTSTGIYCRPICPVRAPRQKNCLFFKNAESAEKAMFRPCLRCRPELAPGNAPVDNAHRIANLMVERINEGLVDDGRNLETIASQFQISSRQLRRIVQKELGVSPIELMQTRRLLLAKQLLTETRLPISQVAFGSGFSSLRRFNDAFSSRYRMSPTSLRKSSGRQSVDGNAADSTLLLLPYRPPYNWNGILDFLRGRMMKEVEWVTEDSYLRTVRLGDHKGWVRIKHVPGKSALQVELSDSLIPVLPALLGRLRNLFDLNARPDLIARHLLKDKRLRKSVKANPGLRVPGAFDGFEMATRAILGQQITVKAATTIACRLADAFGEPIETPFTELTRLSPRSEDISAASIDDIATLGIISARSKSLIELARAVESERLHLDAGADPEIAIQQLTQLPGIGQWTAHYIAMRALRWPDAFPKEDIAVRKNLGDVSSPQAESMSQAWRPWRSYAVLHIWNDSTEKQARADQTRTK